MNPPDFFLPTPGGRGVFMCLWVPAHSRHTPGGVGTQSNKGSKKNFGAFGAKGYK